jgi:CRP-like cAMP-binding protein
MSAAKEIEISNILLNDLPLNEYKLLEAKLELVTLSFGEKIYRHDELIRYVYFPIDSLVSLLTVVDDHHAIEVGMVGNEGMLGIPLALNKGNSPGLSVVQIEGKAFRMSTEDFLSSFHQSPIFQRKIYHYIYAFVMQITQTAACNRFHLVEARLARWLLMTRDRTGSNQFNLTHHLLGEMLGCRRVGITKAASKLKLRNLISYDRGKIFIIDEMGLEAAACHCYQIVKKVNNVL